MRIEEEDGYSGLTISIGWLDGANSCGACLIGVVGGVSWHGTAKETVGWGLAEMPEDDSVPPPLLKKTRVMYTHVGVDYKKNVVISED